MTSIMAVLFGENGFMPHGHCFLWEPGVLWTTVGSDFLIFAAYVAISCALWYFMRRRKDLEFKPLFLLFGVFILACGFTHLADVITVWYPAYWVSAGIKTITALPSVGTAIVMFPLLPQALAIPSPAQLRAKNVELAELSNHLQSVREEEKIAIAAELHDELGSLLTALGMDLLSLQHKLVAEKNPLGGDLPGVLELLGSAIEVQRQVIEDLRPTVLDQFGLASAIHVLVDNFAQRVGLATTVMVQEKLDLSGELSLDLFRIAQEAITNISEHAQATTVSVRLEQNDQDTVLSIRDNGKGVSLPELRKVRSHGVRGMRQRASRWGGSLEITGAPNGGTQLVAIVPRSLPVQ
jgi:signal transduction histidine kinase